MSLLDFFRVGKAAASPPSARPQLLIRPLGRAFAAASDDRLNYSWRAANISADEELVRSLDKLRGRSRDLAQNNEYAKKFLQMCVTHIVGQNGFRLQSQVFEGDKPDLLARQWIENAFWKWSQRGVCEVSGRYSFAELQRQLVRAVARDGEALVRIWREPGTADPFQLQLIEIDRLPTTLNDYSRAGNRVVMGIEMDAKGRPLNYYINTGTLTTPRYEPIPATDIIHLYDPERPEQHRGLPWMHAIMSGLKMLSGFEESAVVAARAGASKMGFFTSPDGNVAPLADAQEAGEFFTEADPGQFGVLPPGYEFQSFNPDYPNGNFDGFVKSRLRGIASGLGVAYHTLASDLEGVNFSSARAGTLEERDNWMVRQNWFIEAFLIPVFRAWLAHMINTGNLKTPSGQPLPLIKYEKFVEHSWQGRRWQWVDPLKDIEAARLAIKTGIASPKSIAAQTGVDLEDILPEIAQFESMVAANNLSLIDYNLTPQAPEPKEDAPEK